MKSNAEISSTGAPIVHLWERITILERRHGGSCGQRLRRCLPGDALALSSVHVEAGHECGAPRLGKYYPWMYSRPGSGSLWPIPYLVM